MKRFLMLLSLLMVSVLLVGCGAKQKTDVNSPVKTGFAAIASADKSTDATVEAGLAQSDLSLVSVAVDKNGKITKCLIDGIQTKINFSDTGKIITDLDTRVKTKTELGTDYGMKKASSIGKEWSEEAAFLANYVVGKTIAEVKGIAVNANGVATASELSSSVTISISGYINAIDKAVSNAQELGAKAGDKLGMGAVTNIAKSTDAGDAEGLAQSYSIYAIVTFDADNKISSCIIDGSQVNVNFTTKGVISSDLKAEYKTKNELGYNYGMKKASTIGKEWFEEAAAFSKYVVGKTVDEVKNISVSETDVPTDNELKSSVTVSIGDFVDAIEKAEANSR